MYERLWTPEFGAQLLSVWLPSFLNLRTSRASSEVLYGDALRWSLVKVLYDGAIRCLWDLMVPYGAL